MATHSSVLAWRIPGTRKPGAAIYGVAQSRTQLKRLSSSSSSSRRMNSLLLIACIFHLFIHREPVSLSHGVLGCTTTLNNISKKSSVQIKVEFGDTAYKVKSESVSCLVLSDSLRLHELQPARLLCPWNSPGNNTGVGRHYLLQGTFPTQEMNPSLLFCRQILYNLSH